MRGSAKPTIASRLAWLVVACVLPAALFAALLLTNQYRQEKARLGADALAAARALAADVDRELTGLQSGLFALATSAHLTTGDLRAFHSQATEALRTLNANNIVLLDAQGRQLVNTVRPFGEPAAGAAPAQALRVFETGQASVTNLFKGTVLQRPIVGVNVPVRRGDKVLFVLGAAMLPERVSALLAQQHLPHGWIAAIVDGAGTLLARNQGIERYLGQQGGPKVLAAIKNAREGLVETETVDGIPVYGAFAHSVVSDWTVGIAIPKEQLAAELRGSLALLGVATAALLAAGLALAWRLARQTSRAIGGLTSAARELALARPVVVPELGLREADEVGLAITESSLKLSESEERLRRILDNMFVFAGVLSLDGRLLEVNRAPLEAAGLTREEVIGRPCAEIYWFSHSSEVQQRLRVALERAAAGEALRYDETIRVRGGEPMIIDLMFSPLRDTSGRVVQIVGSAADITERSRAAERLRELAGRLMETEETERRNLNRELHDRVAANLSAASLGLSMARSQLGEEAAAVRERLAALETLLAQTVRQARDLMAELSPPALTDYGLLAALNAHAQTLKARSGLEVAVSGTELPVRPPLTIETALFRIAQEALNNVLKHGRTGRAEVRLAARRVGLRLTVADSGAGFDPGAPRLRPSWGMRTMRERAEAIGASLTVHSAPGRGTRVVVEL